MNYLLPSFVIILLQWYLTLVFILSILVKCSDENDIEESTDVESLNENDSEDEEASLNEKDSEDEDDGENLYNAS